jgi:PBSX family phage terminase large subunit
MLNKSKMPDPLSPKQVEFIINATKRWNIAHGAVRTGKTVCTAFRFMQAVDACPSGKNVIVGHTFDTAYRNVIQLLMESEELALFRPFLTWSGKKLYYKDKSIIVLGAKDEGALGAFLGDTYGAVYCDEMTLYPQSIIEMIDSRLSKEHSMGFAAMNPKHPDHILKKWIDKAEAGDPGYYSLWYGMDDNPYLPASYVQHMKSDKSGLFYKRNVLGLWCLAEGAIFDFFDRKIHVTNRPPSADYWVAGIDYGAVNPFACILVGVNTGQHTQKGKVMWAEKEYYWNPAQTNRQKTNTEFANDIANFLEPYAVRAVYLDPSAAAFKLELNRRGIHAVPTNNEVLDGITQMSDDLQTGRLQICPECPNLIREIESYVWDSKAAEKGWDEPLKKNDHLLDALRYVCATHKIAPVSSYSHNPGKYLDNRFKSSF